MTKFRCFGVIFFLFILNLTPLAFAGGAPPKDEPPAFISDFQWVTYDCNLTQITTGLQFSHLRWYTELAMGGFSAFDNRESAFFLGLNLGHRFPIKSWLFLTADIGYRHVLPSGTDDPTINTEKFSTLDARFRLEIVPGRHLRFFVGAATTNVYTDDTFDSVDTREGSIFWGVGVL